MVSLTASPSCRLLEVDFAAIEAKLTGYCARDPEYIRLAGLGVHSALASHILGAPYNPLASDADLTALFKSLKAGNKQTYDRCKRAVYGDLYGQTDYGMMKSFPDNFPTLKIAKQYKGILHRMAPTVPAWQTQTRERAYKQNYLGGAGDHPFEYKHWFWDVIGYRAIPESVYHKRGKAGEPCAAFGGKYYAIVLGADAKRCVAYYPQSIAAGVLKEALLRLFDPDHPSYIGDAYFGRTPLRAPIHDSGLFEIPVRCWDRVLERILLEMPRPVPELPLDWISEGERTRLGFGSHLSIGVAAKAGKDWGHMEDVEIHAPGVVLEDELKFPMEEEDEEEFESMRTVLQQAAGVGA